MYIKDISSSLNDSISRFSTISIDDKNELENVLKFGITAIGTLEALVDTVLASLTKAKRELYQTQNTKNVRKFLVEIVTNLYDELDEAQYIVFKFSTLNSKFFLHIRPILSKYLKKEEIDEWHQLFNFTYNTRAISYKKVELLIPEIENFLEARYYTDANKKLSFKELKDYINSIIEEIRTTKKDLQSVKSNFLQLSGLKGLITISNNKLSDRIKIQELVSILSSIEDLVAINRIEKALETLEKLCNHNYPEIIKDIILLQGQYTITNRNFYTGLDNDKVALNRINYGILELVNEIRKRENIA